MTKGISIFLILLLPVCVSGQKLSPTQTKSDLELLKENIQIYNPALSFYCPDFEKEANQEINRIHDSVTILEYFQSVSRICAMSDEGHFGLGSWSDTAHIGFKRNVYKYMPISVKIVGGKIYVWNDYSAEQKLKKGDKITSINDKPTSQILAELYDFTPTDGDIQTYANRTIASGFAWMFYLYIDQSEVFEIVYESPSGETNQMEMNALTKEEQIKNYSEYYPHDKSVAAEDNSFYTLKYKEDLAILTLPSFDYRRIEKYNVEARKLYSTLFDELAENQVSKLIIDLRDNTGGRNEFADEMVPYILKTDNGDSFMKLSTSWKGKEKSYKLPKPAKNLFTGDIFVLINGKTYSAGSTLARYLKEYGNATIIGEESGTRYEGFVAGSSQKVMLPNSQIGIHIPRYHTQFPLSTKQKTSNRGVLPDYQVIMTIADYLADRDIVMENAMELINK